MIEPRRAAGAWRPRAIDALPDGLVLFDGVCALCSGWVRFVIARDAARFFRYAAVQTPYGSALAVRLGITIDTPETNALVIGGIAYFKSDAAIGIVSRLPGWSWTRALLLLPRPLRDWLYDRIARSRYRVFGRMDRCFVPDPDMLSRFVDR